MEYVSAGVNLRADVEKNVQNQFSVGVQKGEADIKIEDMRQHERIDMRRIDLEEKQLDHKLASEGKTIEQVRDLVKEVTAGPVGKAIENLGAGAAERIRGQGAKIPMADVQCPCGAKFKVNASLPSVQCPMCGGTLHKPEQPSQQTEIQKPQQEAKPQETQIQETHETKPIGSSPDPWA